MTLVKNINLTTRAFALSVCFATFALVQPVVHAGVMTFPGLTAIRITEVSGFALPHFFLPASPQMTTQLGALNGGSNDLTGAPTEWYDFFYSDANGAFNVNGNYITAEARFNGQGGGGLNIAAVDLLLGPAPFMICRADILASFVGLGSNYVPGSELLAVDPDGAIPSTFTVMGNTAGVPGRMRVTVGWKKIVVPEPATACIAGLTVLTSVAVLRRRRRSVSHSTRRSIMNRNRHAATLSLLVAIISFASYLAGSASADPLPGRDLLKFSQKPMVFTTVPDATGAPGVYQGHDELSTSYGFTPAGSNQPVEYQGRFMADDFADNLSSPVVHVKWWGSYKNDNINPALPVNKFLIAFESDIPAGPAPSFSMPGSVLQNDVVSLSNALTPGSGQYTEKLIRGPDPILGESLYEYNAELHLSRAFFEQKDTVYWLKVSALVDVPPTIAFDPYNPPPQATQWGWHNRDYTIQDTLASPNVAPGEFIEGTINGTNVWHFQDDAVAGNMRILAPTGLANLTIFQTSMLPQRYIDGIDGPAGMPGTTGISQFSKDLAFELYTIVPEPTSCMLMLVGLAAISLRRSSRPA